MAFCILRPAAGQLLTEFSIFFSPCIFISDLFHQPNDNTLNFVHLGLLKPTYFLQLKTWKSSHVTFYTGLLVILWSLCVFWVWDLFPIYYVVPLWSSICDVESVVFLMKIFFYIYLNMLCSVYKMDLELTFISKDI